MRPYLALIKDSFRAALAVDVNRDGRADIVAINDRERTTTLFLQTESFGFDAGTRIDEGDAMPYALTITFSIVMIR